MATRRGDTLIFQTPPVIAAHAAVGGKKEGEGPLAAGFDAPGAANPPAEASPTGKPPRPSCSCGRRGSA